MRMYVSWFCVYVVICCVVRDGAHDLILFIFFLMIRRPPRSTLDRSSAASDVYKRQVELAQEHQFRLPANPDSKALDEFLVKQKAADPLRLSLIHISEPTRPY